MPRLDALDDLGQVSLFEACVASSAKQARDKSQANPSLR